LQKWASHGSYFTSFTKDKRKHGGWFEIILCEHIMVCMVPSMVDTLTLLSAVPSTLDLVLTGGPPFDPLVEQIDHASRSI
jgi:hypothetical protein